MGYLLEESGGELNTLLNVVNFVFARFTAYITYANEHPALWVPSGFAIAGFTISLFRSAMGINNNTNKYL